MNIIVALYAALLFFILTPGILLRLPKNGSNNVVTATHALVFAVILYFTQSIVWRFSSSLGM